MKKLKYLLLFLVFISLFGISGCSSDNEEEVVVINEYVDAVFDEDGNIVIDTDEITTSATFINYVVDDVTIQFVVVRGSDDVVRVAFNTCSSCNPAPNAYFIQDGEYLICQNCGTKFLIDKIGNSSIGCSPMPVEEMNEDDGKIIIKSSYVDTFKDKFEDWEGLTSL